MAFVEDLSPFFADFGEAVTVNAVAARGIFSQAAELVLGDVLTRGNVSTSGEIGNRYALLALAAMPGEVGQQRHRCLQQ